MIRPELPFLHSRQHRLGAEESAADMDVEHALEAFGSDFLDVRVFTDARIVDQNVDAAPLAPDVVDKRTRRRRVGHVGIEDDGAAPRLPYDPGRLFSLVHEHVVDDDVRPHLREQFSVGAAHAAARAGDPDDPVVHPQCLDIHGSTPPQYPTMVSPPFGLSTCPVMKSASGEARKATA